jgi:spore germination protein YaaH
VAKVRKTGYRRAVFIAVAMVALSSCRVGFISGWVPNWAPTEGRAAFTNPQVTSMFSDISPFFFTANADGTVGLTGSATALNTTIDEAKIRSLKVLPSITDSSGTLVMAAIVADPAARAAHIANIVSLVDTYPKIDGVDLDYEGFAFADGRASWPTTQPNWVAFVTELATALHNHQPAKLLSVTIPPVWVAAGVTTGYTVYDQAAIGAVADRIRLMVYDWSVSNPGPISPISWLGQVIAYSDTRVPNPKLQLGVPSYGRNWGRQLDSTEICPDGALKTSSFELQNSQALIDAHGITPARDPNSGEMKFQYDVVATGFRTTALPAPRYVAPAVVVPRVSGSATGDAAGGLQPALRLTPPTTQLSCSVRHFVYFPDATTIQMHAQAALDAGWSGVVIWALGYETPEVYAALANTTP